LLEAQHQLREVVICYQSVTEQAGKRKQQRESKPQIPGTGIGPSISRSFGDLSYCHYAGDYFSSRGA
jgi:hypothetical protein